MKLNKIQQKGIDKQLLGLIDTEGTIQHESSISLNKSLSKLRKHFPSKDVNLTNIESFIYHVAINGNNLEKHKLVKSLSIRDTFLLGSLSITAEKMGIEEKITNYLSREILNLSQSFGHRFNSDVNLMSFDILNEFGGHTILDFEIFFREARTGKFKKDNHFVSSKGVTREILIDWLNSYSDKKELVKKSMDDLCKKRVNDGDIIVNGEGKTIVGAYKEKVAVLNRLKNKSKKISTLMGYVYYYFCLPYGEGKDEAERQVGNILSLIKNMYTKSNSSLTLEDYIEVMEARYINRIKQLVSINIVDYVYTLLISAYSINDLNEKFGTNFKSISKVNIAKAMMKSITVGSDKKESLIDRYKKAWIDYAKLKEVPMDREQWIFINIRCYFMEGLDSNLDPLYDLYLKKMFVSL